MTTSHLVHAFGAIAGLALGAAALAQDVTRPGDPITPSSANSPAAEVVANAIDNSANTKYLNFDKLNTGFTVTPSGTGIVRAIAIVTANDSPPRDPTSFTLEGSNDGTNFTTIASGTLNPATTRFTLTDTTFPNANAYTQYRVTFPTVRNAATANSMQVAEVQLNTAGNILTAGDGITATYPSGASSPAGEGPAALLDSQLGIGTVGKFLVNNGNAGPTTIDITPAVGASIVTGLGIFGSDNDTTVPGQLPASITLLGSNNGVNYTQLFTTTLASPGAAYQDQAFSFPNSSSYTRYRLVLGASAATTLQIGELQLFGSPLGAAPGNDACASAQNVSAGATSASTINASGTDVSSCGTGDLNDVWFRYVAASTGAVEVNTCGAGTLDTVLSVYASCGGAEIGCNDNACLGKSRVRFSATSGTAYLIRVAGVGGATGSFTLNVVPNPVVHNDVSVHLAYNFNGMVHPGEANNPDDPNGFRSLSDRAIRITGTPGSLDVGAEGVSGIPYSVVAQPLTLDTVQLGNRNTVDNGLWAFDAVPDGDNIGIQPNWLPNPDNSGPQTTSLTSLGLVMGPDTKVGVIANASNGGTSFMLSLNFTDGSIASVFIDVPDWFGSQTVSPAESGVESQSQLGLFFGSALADSGGADVDLNVLEAVVSTASLNAGGIGDFTGKTLSSITFANSTSFTSDLGVYAATIRDPLVSASGVCCRGATCSTGLTQAMCTATGTAGAAFASSASACNTTASTTTPCCYANYNKVNGITVQDIFDFLGDWFAGSPYARTGGNGAPGSLAVQNIFDFLSAWFAGGCS